MAISTSSFNLFGDKIQFLQPSVLMMKDCKPVLLGVFPQPMFFQQLLDLVVSNEWFLRLSKPRVVMMFAGVPFPSILVHFSKAPDHNKQSIEEND